MGVRVIGMAIERVGNDHHRRSELTNEGYDLVEIRLAHFDIAIGDLEVPPCFHSQDSGCFFGLASPDLFRPAGSKFSLCEVGDSSGMAELDHSRNRCAARKLNVIGVRADSQNIYVHAKFLSRLMTNIRNMAANKNSCRFKNHHTTVFSKYQ